MTDHTDCSIMKNSLLGQDLENDECNILLGVTGERQLQSGENLVEMDDLTRTLFILVEGRISVISVVAGNEVQLYSMKTGECAGTRAFVEGTPRPATLRASMPSTVRTLEPDDFESLLDSHPLVVYKFMRGLFRQTHANLMQVDCESQQLSNYINKTGGRY
jgi:CRP-like cAMP-binding protein